MATPSLIIEQREVAPSLFTLRAKGDLVSKLDGDQKELELWQATEATIDRQNKTLADELTLLLGSLRSVRDCDINQSTKHFGEYVGSAYKYWDAGDGDTTRYQLNRAHLLGLLEDYIAAIRDGDDKNMWGAKDALNIQVLASRRSPIPFELLPMGQAARPGTLLDACLRLPAFTCVVQNIIYSSAVQSAGVALLSGGPYRLTSRAFLRSTTTTCWRDMRDYFRREQPQRTFDPAPDDHTLNTPESVANYLLNPAPLKGVATDPLVSDIHVYAHGERGLGFTEKFKIQFVYPGGLLGPKGFWVRSYDVDGALGRARAERQRPHRPLIWFNCCNAGGAIDEVFNMSVDLAEHGCTVIAPRVEISEGFATVFAQDFYDYLRVPLTPGQAFLAARLKSVRSERSNPLGAMYIALGSLA